MKRLIFLSLMLALAMTKAFADGVAGFDGATWYDYRESNYAGGGGSQNDPYLIKTPGQLAKLAYEVNVNGAEGYYKLAGNISLNKRVEGERVLWVPIGISEDKPFKGTLTNPDGYVIEDMMIKANSTGTTSCFGLFGYVTGTVDGIKLEDGEITVSGVSNAYSAGLLCGKMKQCTIKNCTVQGYIEATVNSSNDVNIGGLIGVNLSDVYQGEHGRVQSCVARTEIILTGNSAGTVSAGGVFGESYGKILDCHAVTDMKVSNLSTSDMSHIGGVIGYMGGGPVKYCSASGDIKVDAGSHALTGGLIGTMRQTVNQGNDFNVKYCATTVTISGGYTLGGMIGYCYVSNENFMNLNLVNNVSSSYIDARDAINAGGIIGHLEQYRQYKDNNIWLADGGSSDFFCGTMAKPKSSNYYGTILGRTSYINDNNFSNLWGFVFYYSPMMCNLQSNGMGKTLGSQSGLYGTLSKYSGKLPSNTEGYYGSYGIGWGGASGSLGNPAPAALNDETTADRLEMCFTDNYVLCDLLFYITNDKKALYSASDVTIDFTIEDFTNNVTGERLATFSVPDDVKCVKVVDKHLYPLDPGEVVVTIKWNGLQRKVHLDITYGQEWNQATNEAFEGGNGSKEDPYMIHNADQLYSATHSSKYNKSDVYLKLANDIFINTHLLQKDGTPRTDAKNWNPSDLKANLDGNGKTIYGLYVNKVSTAQNQSFGLFANLYGSVENLAIVDSHVEVDSKHEGINVGLLCGSMKDGSSVSNCLMHGNVVSDADRGGLCGNAEADNISITDIFCCVHVYQPGWPPTVTSVDHSGGVACYASWDIMERCFSIGRVEDYSLWSEGIVNTDAVIDSYYDAQMMDCPAIERNYALTTKQILSRKLYAGEEKWQQEAECYPMLKTFANTPYGKLLAMPVLFDGIDNDDPFFNSHFLNDDWAGNVNYIFEFPTEDVTWSALHGNTYLDVINDCGAASIVEKTDDNVEILIAQAENVESQCTRAMRTLPLNLRSGLTSFRFKDPVAQTAAEAAFDKDEPKGILTLRELVEATKDQFKVFNREAKGLQFFPEFRFFTTTTTLEEGMLSGLDQLCELQLPKKLHTIDTNAFNGCSRLDEITVPATFTTMKMGGLYGSGIKNVLVNPKHKTMESIDGSLFEVDNIGKKHLVVYPPGRNEEDATISTQFDIINDYAFYKIPSLRNIYIDNCLPEGNMVVPEVIPEGIEKPFIHEKEGEEIDVYVNDGSYDKNGSTDMHILFDEYLADSFWGEYYDAGKLHIYYPLTVTEGGWATLYIGFPTMLPKGLIAYVAPKDINTLIEENEDKVILNSIGRIIPKTTPVVVRAEEPGLYKLLLYEGTPPDLNKYENKLIGSYIGQTEMGIRKWGVQVYQEDSQTGGALTLGHNNSTGEVGFFKYNGKEIPPYRAYLGYTNIIEQNANARFMFYIDDIPQGITTGELLPQNKNQSDEWYDLSGRKLNGKPTKKGVYIHNSRAVVR